MMIKQIKPSKPFNEGSMKTFTNTEKNSAVFMWSVQEDLPLVIISFIHSIGKDLRFPIFTNEGKYQPCINHINRLRQNKDCLNFRNSQFEYTRLVKGCKKFFKGGRKPDGIFTSSRAESVPTFLEVQMTEVGEREVAVSVNLSTQKCFKSKWNTAREI